MFRQMFALQPVNLLTRTSFMSRRAPTPSTLLFSNSELESSFTQGWFHFRWLCRQHEAPPLRTHPLFPRRASFPPPPVANLVSCFFLFLARPHDALCFCFTYISTLFLITLLLINLHAKGMHYTVDDEDEDWSSSGDVKYHLGTSMDRTYPDGRR